jgi:hypothetical protein
LVKSLVGLYQSGLNRLCVGYDETPWHDRDRYLRVDEFATLLLEIIVVNHYFLQIKLESNLPCS